MSKALHLPRIFCRAALLGLSLVPPLVSGAEPPRLILQITVDALRGDLPQRYSHLFGEGGFRYLMEEGVQYTNAHYQHANTETIVGHASLATGTVPALHGMVGNVWYDRDDGRLVYNIEDPRYRLLTAGADVDRDTEIDPTQKAASVDGRSPAAMLASTFSDELAVHYNGRSKIFGVSVKDRGAVSLAGHAGKAFWFSKATGDFVTSSYYYDAYPEWVTAWNAGKPALAYAGGSWELMHEPAQYLFGDSDDREYETDFPGYGRTFPHPYGAAEDKYLTTRLTLSPAGDELTLDFAKALLDAEGLGQDAIPDYLSVSFSSTDYVGHVFGASSLESEDNLARLDRTLAELLRYVEEKVGLQNTLVVLSADHGQPEIPEHMNELGMAAASYFELSALEASPGLAALKEGFGIDAPLIEDFQYPYVYLDRELIRAAGLELAAVEAAVADVIASMENIEAAISISALRAGSLADTTINRTVLNNYHPDRSGDIALVLAPYVFINDFDGLTVASTHGSVWRYDRFVPVIFAGAGVRPATVARPVTPYDIAPTLAAFLGVKAPSSAIGEPLPEVLQP